MRRPALLALPAAAVLALTACGGDTDEQPTPAVGTTFADGGEPDAAAPTETGRATGAPIPEVEFDDQSGDGSSVTVARVALTVDGFVAILTDDDDDDGDDDTVGELLGSTAVPAGEATDVRVELSPALTADTELEAVLYGDTDEDGELDPTVDQRIPDTDDGDVSEDASYTVQ